MWGHPHQDQWNRELLSRASSFGNVITRTNAHALTDPDNLVLGKGSQANRTSGIGHKVEERPDKWYDATVCCDAISNCTHSVLADSIADVSALVTPKLCVLRLEVDGALDLSKVAASQVRRSTKEFWKCRGDRREDDLR